MLRNERKLGGEASRSVIDRRIIAARIVGVTGKRCHAIGGGTRMAVQFPAEEPQPGRKNVRNCKRGRCSALGWKWGKIKVVIDPRGFAL
jgi:hypothetical protein